MELKPIEKMDDLACKEEVISRLGGSSDMMTYDWQTLLRLIRENDIGTENLTPPEPEWKRWRKWPEEKPIPFARVEWELKSPQCAENGIYIPFESAALPFRKGLGRGVGPGVCCWRYLTEPPRWKNIERDGEPSEVGWYETKERHQPAKIRRFRFWDGVSWRMIAEPDSPYIVDDIIAYHPIAPAPGWWRC